MPRGDLPIYPNWDPDENPGYDPDNTGRFDVDKALDPISIISAILWSRSYSIMHHSAIIGGYGSPERTSPDLSAR